MYIRACFSNLDLRDKVATNKYATELNGNETQW